MKKLRVHYARRSGAIERYDRMLRHKASKVVAHEQRRRSHVLLNPHVIKMSIGPIPGADAFEDDLTFK